ncbi:MAG: DNA-directed RNA polymerase subunit omega [Epsilonproteobacteria bacterium]|nr:DNA-directed RNA polymerase subunit omega [Campylobacterota bacterium]
MRLEKIMAKALKNMDNDRYLLSIAVAKRVEQLSAGAKLTIDVDKSKYKFSDIALMEIAQNKLDFSDITKKK